MGLSEMHNATDPLILLQIIYRVCTVQPDPLEVVSSVCMMKICLSVLLKQAPARFVYFL
jgi:hypothetical protein